MFGKLAIPFLVFCLTIGSCTAALDARISKTLKDVSLQSLELASLAYPATSTCGGFWTEHGLACDEGLLHKYAEQDAAKIETAKADLYKSAVELNEFIMSTAREDIQKYLPNFWTTFSYQINGANIFLSRMNSYQSKCWDYMKLIRSSSLCSTCSGINYKFYHNSKGRFSLDDCSTMLGKCHDFFFFVFTFFTVYSSH